MSALRAPVFWDFLKSGTVVPRVFLRLGVALSAATAATATALSLAG